MTVKLNETQRALLGAAAQRGDQFLTFPEGPRLAAARQSGQRLGGGRTGARVRARGEAPVWRRDKDGERAFALKLTAAGAKAFAALADDSEGGSQRKPEGVSEQSLGRRIAHRGRVRRGVEDLKHRATSAPFTLVIVDTLATFFDGANINDPVEAGEFLRRLRPMTLIQGQPSVLVAAHPKKTLARAAASTSAPKQIRSPPTSTISMRPAADDGSAEIDTGTSCAAYRLAGAVDWNRLRQVKSILALRPYRCATSATDASGAKLSAMIFRFSTVGHDLRARLDASDPPPGPRSFIDSVHDS